MPHLQEVGGAVTKNLFLKDKKKKTLWLLSVRHDREVGEHPLSVVVLRVLVLCVVVLCVVPSSSCYVYSGPVCLVFPCVYSGSMYVEWFYMCIVVLCV